MNTSESPLSVRSHAQTDPSATIFRPARTTQGDKVLTLETAERGVTLQIGERFSVNLGEKLWHIRIRDEGILSTDGRGSFQALSGGKTKVYFTSDPLPNNSGPPGVQAKLFLEVPVVVICD